MYFVVLVTLLSLSSTIAMLNRNARTITIIDKNYQQKCVHVLYRLNKYGIRYVCMGYVCSVRACVHVCVWIVRDMEMWNESMYDYLVRYICYCCCRCSWFFLLLYLSAAMNLPLTFITHSFIHSNTLTLTLPLSFAHCLLCPDRCFVSFQMYI